MAVSILFLAAGSYSSSIQDNDLQKSMERGKEIYLANCITCHMAQGEGIPTVFPPLAHSDFLKDTPRTIDVILNGASGEMVVNGITYNSTMEGYDLTDQELADLLNYIQNSWGNEAKGLKAEDVQKLKKK